MIHMKNENRHGGSSSYRYYVRLNEKDNIRFLELYEKSGIKNKSEFIRRRLFLTPFHVITHDKSAVDYYTRLTHIHAQIRKVGVLYNQAVRSINTYHSVKTAAVLLQKLEQYTEELRTLLEETNRLTETFDKRWLPR